MTATAPLFVAQEALCYYPVSTIYDSCPRFLFYALLLASCATRWTGWLVDVFLGAAATYAGTAAFQSFILVASPAKRPDPERVDIPYILSATQKNDTRLSPDNFPALATNTDYVTVQPAALELDADAILAIVVTGYLVFLPLQCWSRILSHGRARTLLFSLWNILMLAGAICALVYWPTLERTPTQYMFCYPDLPPYEQTTNDGWESSWKTSTWNESVWSIFSNATKFDQLGDLCYNTCFNTSQILRQQTTLSSQVVASGDDRQGDGTFWSRVVYSKNYIYTLIALCVVLNFLLMIFKLIPYNSRIRYIQPVAIWRERREIYGDLKSKLWRAVAASKPQNTNHEEDVQNEQHRTKPSNIWRYIRPLLSIEFLKAWLHFIIDVAILVGLLFSIIISPFTVIAFVIWIEWYIRNDGPSQESPQQVGQWSYLVSIGLLLISAAILKLKYRLASQKELDYELDETRRHLEELQKIRTEKFGHSCGMTDFNV
jgi:hypothetical protein